MRHPRAFRLGPGVFFEESVRVISLLPGTAASSSPPVGGIAVGNIIRVSVIGQRTRPQNRGRYGGRDPRPYAQESIFETDQRMGPREKEV
jgi:hypothetical protein